MLRVGRFISRDGAYMREIHDVVMDKGDPLFVLAAQYDPIPSEHEGEFRFVFRNPDQWIEFVSKALRLLIEQAQELEDRLEELKPIGGTR